MPKYAAMTVSERLWNFGLMKTFDQAVISGDRDARTGCLVNVDIDADEAAQTTELILTYPTR